MKDFFIYLRNKIIRFFYKAILKKIFFLLDPEEVHDRIIKTGIFLGSHGPTRKVTAAAFSYSNPALRQNILGIDFPNPIGLAAGFDKNAQLSDLWPVIGFGFAELGSITGEPCQGNPKPRLWRLKKSRGLVVNYGLKNDGCEKISQRLKNKKFKIPIGISVAKTNCQETVETEAGIEDYVRAFRKFTDIGAYFTLNISCPNAYGGLPFTDPDRLERLLKRIDDIPTDKPVFLKLPPDLTPKEADALVAVAQKHRIHGFVCTNLTKNRNNKKILEESVPERGGISGKVVEDLSNNLIRRVYCATQGKYVIIGCGGVFSAEDAYKKIKMGASLIQLITGMVFEGPQIISEINQGLVNLLKRDGLTNISQAVGRHVK